MTYYKDGWIGSHEFGNRVLLRTAEHLRPADRLHQRRVLPGVPDGGRRHRSVEGHRCRIRRDYANPISLQTRQARDSNYAFYLQDSWKPNARLTANLGMRFDYVKRVDEVRDITRQKSWTVQPRIGATYLLTEDAKNVLRGSYARLGEQVMGRDGVTTFGADDTVSFRQRVRQQPRRRVRDRPCSLPASTAALAGSADRARPAPAVPRRVHRGIPPAVRLADWPGCGLHQPRATSDMWAQRRHQRHLSRPGRASHSSVSARSIPTRDIVQQQTNNTWSQLKYQAIEMTVTKNMSNGFQLMAGFNRQWHKMDGTWNPTDPAAVRAAEPLRQQRQSLHAARQQRRELAARHRQRVELRADVDEVSRQLRRRLAGARGTSTWPAAPRSRPGRGRDRRCISWRPPIPTSSSTDRRRSRWRTDRTAPNPLATRNRYVFSDRGEGQIQAPMITTVGLKIGKVDRVSALPAGGGGEHLQPAQRRRLHAVQLQQRVPELELELPADGQSAAGAGVPVDGGRPILNPFGWSNSAAGASRAPAVDPAGASSLSMGGIPAPPIAPAPRHLKDHHRARCSHRSGSRRLDSRGRVFSRSRGASVFVMLPHRVASEALRSHARRSEARPR